MSSNNCGKTALKRARKSLEEWKNRKDSELFSSLQHRISCEFIKYRTFNNFYKKNLRINCSINLIREKRKLARMEAKIKNIERFNSHNNLYTLQNKLKADKIIKYERDYRKKEEINKRIREKELAKRRKNEKEYPKEFILMRLDEMKDRENKKNKKLRLKLNKKDLYLNKLKAKKHEICEQRKINLENILKERSYRVYEIFDEQNKLREKKRKEITKRYEEIDKFLYEKELINEQRKNINTHYTNRYQNYLHRIDNILYKKYLDKNALNEIKYMIDTDPVLIGLEENFIDQMS
jgi:hypothetical protein